MASTKKETEVKKKKKVAPSKKPDKKEKWKESDKWKDKWDWKRLKFSYSKEDIEKLRKSVTIEKNNWKFVVTSVKWVYTKQIPTWWIN